MIYIGNFVAVFNTNSMKRLITTLLTLICAHYLCAQTDSTVFRAHLINKDYNVYLRIDLHGQAIIVPGQGELYGRVAGYLGKQNYNYYWPIVTAETHGNKAMLTLINDYGSEDLTATLTCENDSTYILKHTGGSTLKMPEKGKWQKLPKVLVFKRKDKAARK